MSAVWYRFRAELRTRWKSVLALALLVGVAAGIALSAAAGARRTESAFSRLTAETEFGDVLVNPAMGTDSGLDADAIRSLPGVIQAGRADGLFVAGLDRAGDAITRNIVLASRGQLLYDFSRPKLVAGRMPDPGRAREALITSELADEHGVHVGDRAHVAAFTDAEIARIEAGEFTFPEALEMAKAGTLGETATVEIVGIGVVPDGVVVDEGFGNETLYLTPAFLAAHPSTGIPYYGMSVRLRDGAAGIPAFRKAVEALPHEGAIAFQTAPSIAAKFDRAARPSVGVLTVFAVVVALAGMLVVGQALARQSFLDSVDTPVLGALGFTRRQGFAVAMGRTALVAVSGAALAVVVAILSSPLTPIGVARLAEPDPGIRVDPLVMLGGGVLVLVGVLVIGAIPAWAFAARGVRASRRVESSRPSRLATTLAGAGASATAAMGVRMALEPGHGRTSVPVRTTIVAAFLAVAMVTAAFVFAGSLDHLVKTPRLYGWNWDASVEIDSDTATTDQLTAVGEVLEQSSKVRGWSAGSLSDLELDGRSVPALGVDRGRGDAVPSLVSGRMPRNEREIALGARTLRTLDRDVGDTVTATAPDGTRTSVRIVGRVVLPGVGTFPGSDKTALGEGAVVTLSTLDALAPQFGARPFLVDFTARGTSDALVDELVAGVPDLEPDSVQVAGVLRPSDIVAYANVRTTPLVLAAVLALLAAATVAHALVSAVRRRRRDLALLKTLGFSRAQVSATVAWQASTVGAIALVVGIPLGIVIGRIGWHALTDNLGTVSETVVPVLGVLLAVPAVLLLVNAVAYVPGRVAARLRPATVLRSE